MQGNFFEFAAHSVLPSVNSRCNSNVLRAKSRISSPLGAGNFHCQGREFSAVGPGEFAGPTGFTGIDHLVVYCVHIYMQLE
jgi:hypothetical protein